LSCSRSLYYPPVIRYGTPGLIRGSTIG